MTWSIQNIEIGRTEDEEASVGKGRFFKKKYQQTPRSLRTNGGWLSKSGDSPQKNVKSNWRESWFCMIEPR